MLQYVFTMFSSSAGIVHGSAANAVLQWTAKANVLFLVVDAIPEVRNTCHCCCMSAFDRLNYKLLLQLHNSPFAPFLLGCWMVGEVRCLTGSLRTLDPSSPCILEHASPVFQQRFQAELPG